MVVLVTTISRVPAGKYYISVIKERCKECGLCISICSLKVLARSNERNNRGYRYVVPTSPERCTGCRLCEYTCPDFAIFVEMCEK